MLNTLYCKKILLLYCFLAYPDFNYVHLTYPDTRTASLSDKGHTALKHGVGSGRHANFNSMAEESSCLPAAKRCKVLKTSLKV